MYKRSIFQTDKSTTYLFQSISSDLNGRTPSLHNSHRMDTLVDEEFSLTKKFPTQHSHTT